MQLPGKPLPTGSVTIDGTEVPIRALSRLEVRKLRQFSASAEDAEPYIVACGTGVSVEDATEWLGRVTVEDGGALLDEVLILSGLLDREADTEDPSAGSTGEGPTERASSEP
jgi:hypothetical protein